MLAKLQPAQQEEALAACYQEQYTNGNKVKRILLPVRYLQQWIEHNILLELASAPFSKEDAALVPEAGACLDCPKRTGHNVLLFGLLATAYLHQGALQPDQRVDVVFQSPADYWIYCTTDSVAPRLFVDFEADACVIVRDRRQFANRLLSIASVAFGNARHQAGPVEYIDPLLPKTAKIFLPFAKHFGYSYQSECRFCWFPVNPDLQLQHVDLALGSLEDIADLIVL